MEPVIPLISSGTKGPLGVRHLPRLWLKTLLSAVGRLPEGYKDIQVGFDFMVLEGLEIDPDAARNYIVSERPTYLQFEDWIKSQPGSNTSQENIDRVNRIVVERTKSDSSRRKILKANGLDDDKSIVDSITLNNLDDWQEIHGQLLPQSKRFN